MRNKWEERVEFVESAPHDTGEQNKIVMLNGGNGDLYLSVCSKEQPMGTTVRIERSGGASTRNPRLVRALTQVYDAIAGNEDVIEHQIVYYTELGDDENPRCECAACGFALPVSDTIQLRIKGVKFCPGCGGKIH